MRPRIGFWTALFALWFCASATASGIFSRDTLARLAALPSGHSLIVTGFPVGSGQDTTIRFERVEVYAPDAHVYVVDASGKRELPRSDLVFLQGRTDHSTSNNLAISLKFDGTFVQGSGSGPQGAFTLEAMSESGGGVVISARPLESTLPSPDAFQSSCGNQQLNLVSPAPATTVDLTTQLRAAISGNALQSTQALRLATIAIDTDSKFMASLFSNNTANATNWIASMFNTMNTMYQTDLNVQLQIGTTILRTSSVGDPYTSMGSSSASQSDLDLFASYWRANEAPVSRSFAILLSGAIPSSPSSCSASGIAWINQYCQKGFTSGTDTVGSYSVNKVCTSINIDPNGTFNARIVGHEIGHNFGADHTHCTNASNGNSPAASNTIDQCYAGESGRGCYTGTTSCPASGPGSPKGTIMSYCNLNGCGQNVLQFHPTQVSFVLQPYITANTPSCLAIDDTIFKNGFEP
ncbi:MAG: hypothetical protein DYH18_01295 [Xanthomonadales bacterium PRO7]|nr:hypothetical protein [Xanthomonadales bacterium PRO7]